MATSPKETNRLPDEMLREFSAQISEVPTAGVPSKNLALAINQITNVEKALRKLKADCIRQITLQATQQQLSV